MGSKVESLNEVQLFLQGSVGQKSFHKILRRKTFCIFKVVVQKELRPGQKLHNSS